MEQSIKLYDRKAPRPGGQDAAITSWSTKLPDQLEGDELQCLRLLHQRGMITLEQEESLVRFTCPLAARYGVYSLFYGLRAADVFDGEHDSSDSGHHVLLTIASIHYDGAMRSGGLVFKCTYEHPERVVHY